MDFLFDQLLPRKELCNQKALAAALLKDALNGEKVVFYGMRNMGKTSLVRAIVEPEFLAAGGDAVVFADLFGVRTQSDIATRLRIALQTTLQKSFPLATLGKDVLRIAKNLRPSLSVDAMTGKTSLTLKDGGGAPSAGIHDILGAIVALSRSKRVLVVIDEFQDVEGVTGAEGILRGAFQEFPKGTAVLLLGSKKHILARMFSRSDRPFAGWGRDRTIEPIPYEEYAAYMNSRLEPHGMTLTEASAKELQDLLLRIPEPINIACQALIELFGQRGSTKRPRTLGTEEIRAGVLGAVERRQGRFEEFLSKRRDAELKVLIALAKATAPVSQPQGRTFVAECGLSAGGVKKAVEALLDDAVLYKEKDGLVFADPLLHNYLRLFR